MFALDYAATLCIKYEPSLIHFDQVSMRHQYNEFIDGYLKEYKDPIISNNSATHFSEMTSYSVQWWNLGTKFDRHFFKNQRKVQWWFLNVFLRNIT